MKNIFLPYPLLIIFALLAILCSCDNPNLLEDRIIEKQGHVYLFEFPPQRGSFIHDPDCPKCREGKADLQP